MRKLRAIARLVRACVATLCCYSLWFVGHLLLVVAPGRRRPWRRAVMRRWCVAMCNAFAVRVHVQGHPPDAGAFVVCNHLGYLDIPVLGSTMDIAFVSKSEIADWPVIGFMARQFDTVFVVRGRKRGLPETNQAIRRAVERGDGIVVFPEGTSTRGEDVLAFRPSLLEPAVVAGFPVWPVSLSYDARPADRPASLHVCWWGDMEFAPHVVGLAQLDSIEAFLHFAPESVTANDRKEMAEKLHEAVKSRFRPVP